MNSWMYDPVPPWTKPELVNWASRKFGKPKSHFNKMKVKQLWAIYYKDRRRKFNVFYNKYKI